MLTASKDYLSSFFKGEIQYKIPFFQRSYVWGIEYWDNIWENIWEMALVLEQKQQDEHFIGTLIIKQLPAERIGESVYELIDGQQRLTTIAILLKALATTCKNEMPRLKSKLEEAVVFEDTSGNQYIRIAHNRIDKEFFEKVILHNLNDGKDKISAAFRHFLNKVKDLDDNKRDLVFMAIMNRMPVISMLISSEDDEQEIFDTINSLGVKLTTDELLKNFIFKERSLQELYNEKWQSVFEVDQETVDFWGSEKTAGRIIRTNIEVMLYCFLIIQTLNEVKLEKLYKEYKKWIAGLSLDEKMDFLDNLKNCAATYFDFPEGEELNEFEYVNHDKRFFHIIENLSVSTVYPLVLFIYTEIIPEERIKFLWLLETYIVRRNVCRYTTKNYNNLFIQMIRQLKQTKRDTGDITFNNFKSLIFAFNDESNCFPSANAFKRAFLTNHFTNQNSKEILYNIALYHKSDGRNDTKKLSSGSFSVEHIMPKKWESNWAIASATEAQKTTRSQTLLTLGNLTLLTKKLNSSLQNSSWQSKKETLRRFSSLRITTDYLEIEEWNEQQINNRAEDLFNTALQIWPNNFTD